MELRKFIVLCLMFVAPPCFADNFTSVGISKYAVVETTFDYSPVRTKASAGAERFTHLRSGVTLFAEEQNSEFYKIDIGLNQPFWIEKRYVECQGVIPEKRGGLVKSVNFYDDSHDFFVKIKTPIQTSYVTRQKQNTLELQLFDVKIYEKIKVKKHLGNYNEYFDVRWEDANNGLKTVIVTFKSPYRPYGYDVLRENDAIIFKIRKPLKINYKKPLKGVKIALDAGHGGDERGVCAGGYCEKDINLDITQLLGKELRHKGARTILTRTYDKNVGLYDRVTYATKNKADFFISIHQNSLPDPSKYKTRHGAGVYYYNENAKELSQSIVNRLTAVSGLVKDGTGSFKASLAVARPTNPVSVLVECGYLIHPLERMYLTEPKFQKNVAKGISEGIELYLKSMARTK